MRAMRIMALLAGLAITVSTAQAQTDFYKGKTVSIVIGAKGGSLTTAAQIVGNHLGKHIPGNPNVIQCRCPAARIWSRRAMCSTSPSPTA